MGVVSAQHQEEHTVQVVTSSTTKQANIPLPCNGTSQRALAQSPSYTCQLRALAERAQEVDRKEFGPQGVVTFRPTQKRNDLEISEVPSCEKFHNYYTRDWQCTMFVLDRVQNSELGLRAFAERALVQVERNRRSGNIIIISGPLWTRQPLST